MEPDAGARWEEEFVAYVAASSVYLRATAFVLCGDWHRADDLLQVTFLKLYRVWPRLVRRGELDGYARRMIVRAFLSENRRKWRSREHLPGELPDGPAAPDPLAGATVPSLTGSRSPYVVAAAGRRGAITRRCDARSPGRA